MNCSDWEQQIASELESAELDEHLRGCERCREFAGEIEKNRAALIELMAELTIDPAAFAAVRARVRGEIEAKRRMKWWTWSAVAAAMCIAVLCASYFVRPANAPPPEPVVAAIAPPADWNRVAPAVRQTSSGPHLAKARRVQKTEPVVAVKMLTDDPNVIIIWLVDQKGDSL
jgi:hypothetical protein